MQNLNTSNPVTTPAASSTVQDTDTSEETKNEFVHVIILDTRFATSQNSMQPGTYKYIRHPKKAWEKTIVNNTSLMCIESPVAKACGINLKMYVKKYQPGFHKTYEESGMDGVIAAMTQPGALATNNGGASLLTANLSTGLTNFQINGLAYVVRDDGDYPLADGQVWGLLQIVDLAGNYFGDSFDTGRAAFKKFIAQYKAKRFAPGGGVDIYSPRPIKETKTS